MSLVLLVLAHKSKDVNLKMALDEQSGDQKSSNNLGTFVYLWKYLYETDVTVQNDDQPLCGLQEGPG